MRHGIGALAPANDTWTVLDSGKSFIKPKRNPFEPTVVNYIFREEPPECDGIRTGQSIEDSKIFRALFKDATQEIERHANIRFEEVDDPAKAEWEFALVNRHPSGVDNHVMADTAIPENKDKHGNPVDTDRIRFIRVYRDALPHQETAQKDPYSYMMGITNPLHEIMHALGARHPFLPDLPVDGNFRIVLSRIADPDSYRNFSRLPKDQQTKDTSIMNYQLKVVPTNELAGYKARLKPVDITFLQEIYGPSAQNTATALER